MKQMNNEPMTDDEFLKGLLEKHGSGVITIPNSAIPENSVYVTDPESHADYIPRIIDADTGEDIAQTIFNSLMQGVSIYAASNIIEAIVKGLSDDE